MFRRIVAIISLNLFLLNYGFSFAGDTFLLEPALKEARENNPEILAAKKRYDAAKARIPQAKSLEDPTLSLGFEKAPGSPFRINKTMSEDRMLSVSQFFPLFGKLSLKGKIALVESQMIAAEYKQKELEIINKVKIAYYSLFMNYKEIELSRESLRLLENINKTAEAKFAVGQVSQEEVYKIHLEIARLNNNIENLGKEQKAKETILAVFLNKDPEINFGIPEINEDISFDMDIRSLYQETILSQPELSIFAYAIERNKFAKSLAKKSFFPDLMAQITQRGFTTGTIGPWDLMLAFSFPLWFWTKQRYEVKEAIANLEEAEAVYQAMQNKAFNQVKEIYTKIEIAKSKIKLYKTSLIPILESSIRSSMAAFSSGKGDFMMLLDNQRMLIGTKMDYFKALVDYNMSLADLESEVGKDLAQK